MDIWKWVNETQDHLYDSGEERLVEIMEDMPGWTCDDEHHKVDAVYHEGLHLARKLDLKWVEVFIRHWHLQSQVLSRQNVNQEIVKEALDLIDFCHQEETRDCPQSICAVQDYANCYGALDGPGYAGERLAIAKETLDKIDGSWPCYHCIGSEYLDALEDSNRTDDILETVKTMRQELKKFKNNKDAPFVFEEVDALLKLEKFDEAKKIMNRADNQFGGEGWYRKKQGTEALIWAKEGQDYQVALEKRLPFHDVLLAQSQYPKWAEVTFILVKTGALPNDDEINAQFTKLVNDLTANGVQRNTLKLLSWQAELAFDRGGLFSLKQSIERYKKIVPELRKDLGASEELARLEGLYTTLQGEIEKDKNTISPESVLEKEYENIEAALSDTAFIHEKHPENKDITAYYGSLLMQAGYIAEAGALAKASLDADKNQPALWGIYGEALLSQNDIQTLLGEYKAQLDAADLNEECRHVGFVQLALYYRASEPETALSYVNQVLDAAPDAYRSRFLAASIEGELGNYQKSLAHWNAFLDNHPDEVDIHWDRMIAATMCDEWDTVHESLKALEIDVGGRTEGPIEEEGEIVRIQFETPEGGKHFLHAQRTGPVTARIVEYDLDPEYQHYCDVVVFQPTPLNALNEKDEDGHYIDAEGYDSYLYPYIDTYHNAGYQTFDLDGVKPGSPHLESLLDWFVKHGIDYKILSDEGYIVFDEGRDEELSAFYLHFAVPSSVKLEDVHQYLSDFNEELKHRIVWPALLAKIDDKKALKKQEGIIDRYCLF